MELTASLDGMAVAPDDPLVRAVVISLLTWRRADDSDEVPPDGERMGWWGDSVPSVAGDRIGSKLWLRRREKLLPETVRRIEDDCRDALKWLVDDGHVTAVSVAGQRAGDTSLAVLVALTMPEGRTLSVSFGNLWSVIHV